MGVPTRLDRGTISLIIRRGRRVETPHLTIRIMGGLPHPAFSVVVPNRVARTATARNRLKRQLRQVSRDFIKTRTHPTSFVLFAKKGAGTAGVSELFEEISKALQYES